MTRSGERGRSVTAFYEVPAFVLLFGAMALAAVVAGSAHLLVRRRFRTFEFSSNNNVGGIVLGVLGGLYAIMLAFVVGIVWREYDDSGQRVAGEVAAATNVWYAASGLPQPQRREARAVLLDYAELMVHDEWPAMRHGGRSAQAVPTLARAFELIARVRLGPNGEQNAQQMAMQQLGVMQETRYFRLDDNESGLTPFQWTILLVGSALVIAFCFLLGTSDLRVQLLMTGSVAAMIALIFVLIYELDYPFRGGIGVPPDRWTEFIADHRLAHLPLTLRPSPTTATTTP
jgi:hypothetical protein